MRAAIAEAKAAGVTHMAFGDLFLDDIREYRVRLLDGTGVEPLFPIWTTAEETPDLARQDAGGRSRGGPDLRGPQAVESAVRGPAVRRDAPGGTARRGRSVRRAGRVPHVLLPVPRSSAQRSPSRSARSSSGMGSGSPIYDQQRQLAASIGPDRAAPLRDHADRICFMSGPKTRSTEGKTHVAMPELPFESR